MKNVSNLIGWSVVVLLLLVGGANAGAKLFQQTPDEDSRTLQPTPKATPNKRQEKSAALLHIQRACCVRGMRMRYGRQRPKEDEKKG